MLSNALIALAGAILAKQYADVNSGLGTIVVALAAIVISEGFSPTNHSLDVLSASCTDQSFTVTINTCVSNISKQMTSNS